PIDVDTYARVTENWDAIKGDLIADVDQDYHIFDGTTFKYDRFEAYLARTGIPWQKLESGKLSLSDDAFKQGARSYALQIGPLRELRSVLSDLKLRSLTIGADGRNRTPLWAFGSKTGRNTPSNSKFAFGPAVWVRSFIKPEPGYALAYLDW